MDPAGEIRSVKADEVGGGATILRHGMEPGRAGERFGGEGWRGRRLELPLAAGAPAGVAPSDGGGGVGGGEMGVARVGFDERITFRSTRQRGGIST